MERANLLRRTAALELVSSKPVMRVIMVALFAALTALGAYVAVPVPGTMVPVSLQTLFVTLAGALLGPALGAASQVTYLVIGALGAPVFAGGMGGAAHLIGPTGGYLLAFPVAAWLVGAIAGRTGDARLMVALIAANLLILAGGAAQLTLLTGDAARAFALGVTPFLIGSVIKTLVAFAAARRIRNRTLGMV